MKLKRHEPLDVTPCLTLPKDHRIKIRHSEYLPLVIGGMGVDVSTSGMVLEAVRLGCVGHLSDAMVPMVCDKRFGTNFVQNKIENHYRLSAERVMQDCVPKYDLSEYRKAQLRYIGDTVERKRGTGGVFVNCMEKLLAGFGTELLEVRLKSSLDAGADGITLSAGLHQFSMMLMSDHPRFHDANIGVVVSSWRALKIFLRSANKTDRLPDYIVVEGPLAGGHLGFGADWAAYNLKEIVTDILNHLAEEGLNIPVIPAGGIFDSEDLLFFLGMGAAAVQVATRFAVTKESGLSDLAKQAFFDAEEEDVHVSGISPTGFPIRLLRKSPCLNSNIAPRCVPFGFAMDSKGHCQYLDAYNAMGMSESGRKLPVTEKVCLCHHIGRYDVWTCGANVVRLKETAIKSVEGIYAQPSTEQVIREYLGEMTLPKGDRP
jgi:nitronate monooxygenase